MTSSSSSTAFKFGDKIDDPMAMYLNDVATIPANLAGIPGLSLPVGCAPEDGLPVGLQILAPARGDKVMYEVAARIEAQLAASEEPMPPCPAANWKEALK